MCMCIPITHNVLSFQDFVADVKISEITLLHLERYAASN